MPWVGLKLPLKCSRGFSVCFGLFFMHLGVLSWFKANFDRCFKPASKVLGAP
jgi:hypothetical protein